MSIKGYGIPRIISYGRHGLYNVLIEELLGISLDDILEKLITKKFNLNDVCMIGLQCLERLEYIHSKYVVHRDIKPPNLVIGKNDPNILYLIDFGFSRKYRSSRTGKHIKFNNLKLTFGSLRYLSINGNRRYEQSRRDDLESLGYMLIYIATGKLPWLNEENLNINIVKKYMLIYNIKKQLSTEKLCEGLPEKMIKYMDYCKGLYFEQDPDYDYLQSLFKNILIKINQKNDLNFCWLSNKIVNQGDIKAQSQSQSKNKKKYKKSVSPHIRLLNKIEKSLQKSRMNLYSSASNTKINIGFISNLEKPINTLFKRNDENINIIGKNDLNIENEYNNIKNNINIDTKTTKEKDIKTQNTEKSQSKSYNIEETLEIKNNGNINNNLNENSKIITNNIKPDNPKINFDIQNDKTLKNIKIIDDEKCVIYEFNYQNTNNEDNANINKDFEKNKQIDKLNIEEKDKIDIKYKKLNFIENIKKNLDKKKNQINFQNKNDRNNGKIMNNLSNNNFWENYIENENKKIFSTYNNVDLKPFDISNYNSEKYLINSFIFLK